MNLRNPNLSVWDYIHRSILKFSSCFFFPDQTWFPHQDITIETSLIPSVYICGCYTLQHQRRNISLFVKRAYKAYFEVNLGDQDKQWAPHVVCHNCEEMLRSWTKGNRNGLPFRVPMIWREPTNHVTDCYFCTVNTAGVGKKNRHKIVYPNIPSAIQPAPHSKEVPVPVCKGLPSLSNKEIGHDKKKRKTVVTKNCQKLSGNNPRNVLQRLNLP